jgi:hypothetical protein
MEVVFITTDFCTEIMYEDGSVCNTETTVQFLWVIIVIIFFIIQPSEGYTNVKYINTGDGPVKVCYCYPRF